MVLLSFAEIDNLLIEHRRAEEARNAPAAVACRALDDLREALAQMEPAERAEVVDELRLLLVDEAVTIWDRVVANAAIR